MVVCEFWNTTQAVSHSGSYSATDVGNLEMRQDFAPVSTSDISQLGFWVMNPNTFEAVIGYELFYADNPHPVYYFNFFIDFLPNSDWTYIDMTGHLQHGAQLVGIGINGEDRSPSTPAPRLYVDDVVLNVALSSPETSSSALVGAGALALMVLALRSRSKRAESV